jgi:hypothetical protein
MTVRIGGLVPFGAVDVESSSVVTRVPIGGSFATDRMIKRQTLNSQRFCLWILILTPNYPPPRRKTKEEMLAEASGFSDEIRTSVPHQPLKFDWKFFLIAMAVLVGVFGTIIGIGRSKHQLRHLFGCHQAPTEMTNTTTSSTVDMDCVMMTMNFTANNLVLTMSVQSSTSGVEIDYTTAVLEKAYTSMLQNELTQLLSQYCDP